MDATLEFGEVGDEYDRGIILYWNLRDGDSYVYADDVTRDIDEIPDYSTDVVALSDLKPSPSAHAYLAFGVRTLDGGIEFNLFSIDYRSRSIDLVYESTALAGRIEYWSYVMLPNGPTPKIDPVLTDLVKKVVKTRSLYYFNDVAIDEGLSWRLTDRTTELVARSYNTLRHEEERL